MESFKPGSPSDYSGDGKQLTVGTEKPFIIIPKREIGRWRLAVVSNEGKIGW